MPTFQPHNLLFADRQLERQIVNHLVRNGRPDLCTLRIRAGGGVVRLRGQLATAADRSYVLQGICRVDGVLDVKDEIRVSAVAPSAISPQAERNKVSARQEAAGQPIA